MLIAPFRALFSGDFYIEYLKKPSWTAFWFTLYVFAITAVFVVIASGFNLKPGIDTFIDKVAQYTPAITIEGGKMTVNDNKPLTIAPAELDGYKIHFDTSGDAPVYPTEMERSQTLISVTASNIYVNYQGSFRETKINDNNVKIYIDSDTIIKHKAAISKFVFWSIIIILIIAMFFRLPFMIVLAFAAAAVFNGATSSELKPAQLLKLACYMQAPAAVLYILNFASPYKVPGLFFVYLILFGAYCYMIMRRLAYDTANQA